MNNIEKAFKQKGLFNASLGARKAARVPGYKDGAVIPGHDLTGKDDVPFNATRGEAVLPVRTVDALGGAQAVKQLITQTNGKAPATGLRAGGGYAGGAIPPEEQIKTVPTAGRENPLLTRGADGALRGDATLALDASPAAPAVRPPVTPAAPAVSPVVAKSTVAPAPALVNNGQIGRSAGLAPAAEKSNSVWEDIRTAPNRVVDGFRSDMSRDDAIKAGTATPYQLRRQAEDARLSNDPGVNNPWADIPILGLGARAVTTAGAAAPGIMGGIKNGARAVTDFFGKKTAAAAPAAAPIAASTVAPAAETIAVNGVNSAERIAADKIRQQMDARFAGASAGAVRTAAASGSAAKAVSPVLTRVGAVGAANSTMSNSAPAIPKALAAAPAPVAAAATDPAVAAQQAATAQAEAALPVGLQAVNGALSSDALFKAQPGAVNGAAIRAAQDRQVQNTLRQGLQAGNVVSGDGTPITTTAPRYANPAVAELRAQQLAEAGPNPAGLAAGNAFARAQAKGMNAGTLARDNASFASQGMNVTKSSDGKGGVLYSNTATNPFMNSKFSDGRTGNAIAADNKVQQAAGLQEAQVRQQAQAANAVVAQRQQLMLAVQNAPTAADKNAATNLLNAFNSQTQSDNLIAAQSKRDESALRAAQYQYQTAREDRGQVREMDARKQGFTEYEATLKKNDDMIRALSMDPSTGKLDTDKYAQNSAFATSSLASLKDAKGVSTPKDLGNADADTMKQTRLALEARNAEPRFNDLLSAVSLGASKPMNLTQSMPTDRRDRVLGPEYLINGAWIPASRITGASFLGHGGDKEQVERLDEQLAEYRKQSAPRTLGK